MLGFYKWPPNLVMSQFHACNLSGVRTLSPRSPLFEVFLAGGASPAASLSTAGRNYCGCCVPSGALRHQFDQLLTALRLAPLFWATMRDGKILRPKVSRIRQTNPLSALQKHEAVEADAQIK